LKIRSKSKKRTRKRKAGRERNTFKNEAYNGKKRESEKERKKEITLRLKIIVYYVMRSKNEVLCAAAGRLAAERSEADKPAKCHNLRMFEEKIIYEYVYDSE
jgi:hypothetical protein